MSTTTTESTQDKANVDAIVTEQFEKVQQALMGLLSVVREMRTKEVQVKNLTGHINKSKAEHESEWKKASEAPRAERGLIYAEQIKPLDEQIEELEEPERKAFKEETQAARDQRIELKRNVKTLKLKLYEAAVPTTAPTPPPDKVPKGTKKRQVATQ